MKCDKNVTLYAWAETPDWRWRGNLRFAAMAEKLRLKGFGVIVPRIAGGAGMPPTFVIGLREHQPSTA